MNHPWDQFKPATIEFCENLLNDWVRQPANTWSNVGFLIVGYWIWRNASPNKRWLHIFAVGSILVGMASASFHLSMIFTAQFFDVSSMFLTAGMLVVLNLMRMKWIKPAQIYKVLIALQLLAMMLMYFFQGSLGEQIFAGEVFFIVLSEFFLIKRDRPTLKRYRWWAASLLIYLAATLVWILDIKKMWCNPENHWFSGHALWHLLNAAVVWTLYRFYDENVEV